jgi:two-component system, NtrC family, response regulator AtoC
MLLDHEWPGNVRQLQNVLERAAVLADGDVIEPQHLSLPEAASTPLKRSDLAAVERRAIEQVLRGVDWNKSRAAKALGISRTQLYFRLRKYQLETPAN